jgi:hypothetical protein
MSYRYIVRYGHESGVVTGAVAGGYKTESHAELAAWNILGIGDEDSPIAYSQVVRVNADGSEELLGEFEF